MKYLVSLDKKKTTINFIKNIVLSIPKFLNKIEVIENNSQSLDVIFYLSSSNYLLDVINFFKNNSQLQYEQLIDIVTVDYLNLKEINNSRFRVFYQLLSLRFNKRIFLSIRDVDKLGLLTITSFYACAGWLEREIWDMFGVFFWQHPDLRRILTDYGFKGFPLRKDFPLSGFSEVRYDDEIKLVFYEPIELTQEFRYFDALSPWIKN